jgi:septal ring factor EnvC (AmiA/AmiB activator)
MNRLILLVVMLSTLFVFADAQSLSKQEKKQVKKELKNFKKNPESYVSGKEKTKNALQDLRNEVSNLKDQIAKRNSDIESLKDEIAALKIKNLELENALTKEEEAPELGFRVQIGYYKVFDINKYLVEPKTVVSEEIDDANRYSIGYFTDLEQAVQFRNDLRKMGIKDAFVSKYNRGSRDMEFKHK